jgi:hypothetical protein
MATEEEHDEMMMRRRMIEGINKHKTKKGEENEGENRKENQASIGDLGAREGDGIGEGISRTPVRPFGIRGSSSLPNKQENSQFGCCE